MKSGWHFWKDRRGSIVAATLAIALAVSAAAWWVSQPRTPRELYEARCAACHALPDLSAYGPEQRAAIVATMRRKNGAAAVIDDKEAAMITSYLTEEAKEE